MGPRAATTGAFFVNGAVVGVWVTQIPNIQDRFELSGGSLGLVLLAMALGVIVTLPIAGQMIIRYGSARVTAAGTVATCLLVVPVPLMPHAALTAAALFLLGAASGTMEVGTNAHGVEIERTGQRPVLSSLHAGWAAGGITGAALGAAGTAAGLPAGVTVAMTAGFLLAVAVGCVRHLGPGSPGAHLEARGFVLPARGVWLLALLAMLVMIAEGAIADWGGLLLRHHTGASAAIVALAYASFSTGMTLGRLVGDSVNQRIGPAALLRWGALLTAVPLAALLVIGRPGVALAGIFLVGTGLANGVPILLGAAARRSHAVPGPAIAAVSSMGSIAFLAGPPIIGFVADAISLPWALALIVPSAVGVFALAGRAVGPSPWELTRVS